VDNLTLRRFLRARDHNVDKAAAMFLKFLKWRREAVPDGFVPEERVRRELAQDKAWMGGVDRAGRPILVGFMARHYSAERDMAEYKSMPISRSHSHSFSGVIRLLVLLNDHEVYVLTVVDSCRFCGLLLRQDLCQVKNYSCSSADCVRAALITWISSC
jgi:hypothetical protein